MTPENSPTPFEFIPGTSTEDQLAKLCRVQQKRIASLHDQLERALHANRVLSRELLEASEARGEALSTVATLVANGKAQMHRLVHERDIVVAALRKLVNAVTEEERLQMYTPEGLEVVAALREARELLKVIDQAQAAAAPPPPVQ